MNPINSFAQRVSKGFCFFFFQKKIFRLFGPQVGLKLGETRAPRAPWAPPLDSPLVFLGGHLALLTDTMTPNKCVFHREKIQRTESRDLRAVR